MIEYANESVVKFLKQYDMLSKSLNFTVDSKQKQEICYQMTRIIQNVLNLTNKIYEKKYLKIVNRSTYLMDEEKNRLLELINLINERRTYVNNQISNNVELTLV
jgi:DNA replication initiation complex subunit (GINS family)